MPAPEPIITRSTYQVGNGPVFLSVSVGRKQHGSVLVIRPSLPPFSGSTDVVGLLLGDGPSLVGQMVRVITTVTFIDPQAAQGKLIVDYTLAGGGADPNCDQEAHVPELFNAVQFVLELRFTV